MIADILNNEYKTVALNSVYMVEKETAEGVIIAPFFLFAALE